MTRQDVAQLNTAHFFAKMLPLYPTAVTNVDSWKWSLGANIYVIFETQEIKTEHCLWHLLTTSLAQR